MTTLKTTSERIEAAADSIREALEEYGCVICIDTVSEDTPRMYIVCDEELEQENEVLH